ncbi:integrator complex subunit 15-like [Haliotis asinina]|uniref:integrator complex subunit 15-like n=1 Tax=Haliotis asinina TaxID=109174 RepID=UPI003531D4FB
MSTIMKKLKYLEFPDCTREALSYLATCFSSQEGAAIPGLGGGAENFAADVCSEYILFRTRKKKKKLSAIQELQLLEMLCTCFKETPTKSKYHIFNLIFGGRGDNSSNTLLTKLVSMALSVSCSPVLDCAAIWMQERGADSPCVLDLSQRVVEDYCLLFPSPSQVFLKLPSVSPLFVCNFIASVTSIHTLVDKVKILPQMLLEHVTEWITEDCTLCCESVRQVSIHNTYCSPIPGLTGWCVRGPIIFNMLRNCKPRNISQENITKTLSILSKLHLGLLQSLQFCENTHMSQYLLTVGDVMNILNSVVYLQKKAELAADNPDLHTAIERLAQVMQVAIVSGCLRMDRGNFQELRSIVSTYLPSNRLLHMVLHHLGGEETPMDIR